MWQHLDEISTLSRDRSAVRLKIECGFWRIQPCVNAECPMESGSQGSRAKDQWSLGSPNVRNDTETMWTRKTIHVIPDASRAQNVIAFWI